MPPQRASTDDSNITSNDPTSEKPKGIAPEAVLKDAELVTEKGHIITKDGVLVSTDDSDDALVKSNPFLDPEVKAYYVDLYEKSQYECRHVFDAELTWTEEEEKKLVRKLDWRGAHNFSPNADGSCC